MREWIAGVTRLNIRVDLRMLDRAVRALLCDATKHHREQEQTVVRRQFSYDCMANALNTGDPRGFKLGRCRPG